jgi:hypothetical protein
MSLFDSDFLKKLEYLSLVTISDCGCKLPMAGVSRCHTTSGG